MRLVPEGDVEIEKKTNEKWIGFISIVSGQVRRAGRIRNGPYVARGPHYVPCCRVTTKITQ